MELPARWVLAHVAQELHDTDRAALDFVMDGDTELREVEAAIRAGGERARGRRARGDAARALRRDRRLRGALAGAGADVGARVRAGGRGEPRRLLLGGLAHAAEPRARPHVPLRPPAPRRADEPPRPRRRDVARGLAQGVPRRAAPHHPRPRVPRFRRGDDRARRRAEAHVVRGKLFRLRAPAGRAARAAAVGLREPAAHHGAPAGVHRPLPGEGHQGPPGAEPHQGAGEARGDRGRARRLALHLRLPRAAREAEAPLPRRGGERGLRRQGGRLGHRVERVLRRGHRPAGPQWRGEVDAPEDDRRRPAARGRHDHPLARPAHRLLRAAPGGEAAARGERDVAPRAPGARRARAGAAQFPGRLRLPRRPGLPARGRLLRRREGAPGARPHRVGAAQPARAGRAHQPPRHRDAGGARAGAAGLRGHAHRRGPRPAPAGGGDRPVVAGGRREGRGLRRRPRRLPRVVAAVPRARGRRPRARARAPTARRRSARRRSRASSLADAKKPFEKKIQAIEKRAREAAAREGDARRVARLGRGLRRRRCAASSRSARGATASSRRGSRSSRRTGCGTARRWRPRSTARANERCPEVRPRTSTRPQPPEAPCISNPHCPS